MPGERLIWCKWKICRLKKNMLSLFYKKANDTMTDEEKEKDEWSWDDEDPVADKADFLYSYKLAADVLQKKRL